MQIQERCSRIKKGFFNGLVEIRCFDLHSSSILMIVCLIRFITEMTVIDFSQLIGDSWFQFLFEAEKFMNIFIELQQNIYQFCGIIFILLTCLAYFYCLFTIQMESKSFRVKSIFLKVFSLVVYTFRVFLVKGLSQIIGINYPIDKIEWVVIAALAIASLILVMIIVQEFYVSISLQSGVKSLLIKSPHPLNTISEGTLLTTVILSQLLPKQNILVTAGLCFLFIVSYTLKLLTSTLRKKYPDVMMESIEKVQCMSGIIFYLLVIPGYYIELLKQNLLVSDIMVIIFCLASYSNYLKSLRNHGINFLESIFKSKQELQARKGKFFLFQAHYLIHYINHLMTEYKGQKQQILLSGIFSQHVRSCKFSQCYCLRVSQNNSIQKLMMEKQFRGKFLLSFVQNIYNEFNHQFDIFALYLMFKLQVIGIFSEIEHAIIKYQTTNHSHLNISKQFILFQIKRTLKKTIDEKNLYVSNIKLQNTIQQEQKCKYLINLMKMIVQLTVKKYRLLSETITNLKSVQQNVDRTSALIKQIQLNYLEQINKNSYNLYTQTLFYQYFSSISETNSQAAIILNNIVMKSNSLKSIKGITTANMEKYLYEDNCCVLETCLQPDKMGNITNLNENSLHVFGLKKQQLIHQNIKKIIPKHFNQEHQKLMKIWLSTASYQNINQLRNIYLTNQKSTAFKSIVYHQITTSMDRVKFYVMVLKFSGDNFLMLDKEMRIQGFGYKIKDNILSLKTLKQPIKNYCLNTRVLPEDIDNLQQDKDYKIDLLLCQQKGNFGEIKFYDPTANLAQQIQQFAFKVLQSNRQLRVLKCKISMFSMSFGNIKYVVMKLIDVIQHTMLQADIEQFEDKSYYSMSAMSQGKGTSKNLGRQKVLLGQNSFTYKNLQQCPQNDMGQEFVDGDEESTTQINSEDDQLLKNYQLQEMQNQSTSSISRQSVSYSFKKLMKLIKEKFLLQKNVTYRQLNNITLTLAILIIILFSALIVQYIFYKSRLQSFQKIMDANQQVSDTLQYVELMFSQSLLIYQNCIILSNGSQCDKAINSISFSYNNLFEQVSTQTQNFITSKATEDFAFYQYLNEVVKVKLSRIQSQMTIQSFLSVFYHAVKKIALHFQKEKTMNAEMENSYIILRENWDLVVKINHQVLQIYQQKGLYQIDIISTILFCITGGVIFLNLMLVVLINYFIGKSIDKRQKIIRNYEYIPISYVEQLKRYFQNLLESLTYTKKSKQQLKKQEFPSIQDNPYYRPKTEFFYSRSFVKRLLFLLTFFVFLTTSNLFSLFEMRRILQPFETIFVEESEMISSQKNVIQSYYELKRNYLLGPNEAVRNQRLALLEPKFQKREVQFNDRAIKLLQIFNDTTSQYYQDFKHLLKDDICEISKPIISQWQYNSCKNSHLEYPQYGIFSSMILIQRASMSALYILKTLPPQVAPMVLSGEVYQDIDFYIIYAVKVFYLMETRINKQMRAFLQNAYFACLLMIMFQFLLLSLGIITWVWFFHKKKKQFTKLYGHVIMFPNQVIIKNKLVMKSIEQTLLIKDY